MFLHQSQDIFDFLREAQVDEEFVDKHIVTPYISKKYWNELGNLISSLEKDANSVEGQNWMSLRLDGNGFSKQVNKYRRNGIFCCKGFSIDMTNIMQICCQELMTKFNVKYAFTQSDEIILLIPSTNCIKDVQYPHMFNGRKQKLASLASSFVTNIFNFHLNKLAQDKKIEMSLDMYAMFDCRVASFISEKDALSLLMWRGYDCGVNGVSDAVHHSGIPGARKDINKHNTIFRLKWLTEQQLLPLPDHQAYGSFYVMRKLPKVTINPINGQHVTVIRNTIVKEDGHIFLTIHKQVFNYLKE